MGIQTILSIGRASLRVIGLNPQRISTESEARYPGSPTWQGMDFQSTGLGEKRTAIQARTAPHVFGGMDALGWLIRHHEGRERVPFIRLGANFAGDVDGEVVIRSLYYEEEKLHPFDGRGRIMEVEIDLLHIGVRR